jgi:hypothetical protein
MPVANVRPVVTKILNDPGILSEFRNKPARLQKTFGLTKAEVEALKASGIFSKVISQNPKAAVAAPANGMEVLLTGPVENPRIRTGPIPISRKSARRPVRPRKYPAPPPPVVKPPVHPAPGPPRPPRHPPTHPAAAIPWRPPRHPVSPQTPPRHRPVPWPVAPRPRPWRGWPLAPIRWPGWRRRHLHPAHCDCCMAILEMTSAAARAIETVASRYTRKVRRRRVY